MLRPIPPQFQGPARADALRPPVTTEKDAQPVNVGDYSCRAVARFVEHTLAEIRKETPALRLPDAAAVAWYRGGLPHWQEHGHLGYFDGGGISLDKALGYLTTLPEWDRLSELARHHARRLVYAYAALDGLTEPVTSALRGYPTREEAEALWRALVGPESERTADTESESEAVGDGGPRTPPVPTRAADRAAATTRGGGAA